MNKLFKSRKAEDMMVDFVTIFVFAIIIVIFFIIFNATKQQSTVDTTIMFQSKDADFMVNSFLMAEVDAKGTKTVADVIADDVNKNDFTNTEQQFKLFFSNINIYNGQAPGGVTISIYNGNTLVYDARLEYHPDDIANSVILSHAFTQSNDNMPHAISYVPLENNNLLKVRLQVNVGK